MAYYKITTPVGECTLEGDDYSEVLEDAANTVLIGTRCSWDSKKMTEEWPKFNAVVQLCYTINSLAHRPLVQSPRTKEVYDIMDELSKTYPGLVDPDVKSIADEFAPDEDPEEIWTTK